MLCVSAALVYLLALSVTFAQTYPLYRRPGGRKQQPRLRKQYRPIETAVLLGAAPAADWEDAWIVRMRSPRIMTSGWITVLPPSMMFWVPTRVALRATLLPVSCASRVSGV